MVSKNPVEKEKGICNSCGGDVEFQYGVLLLSNPPKIEGVCVKCGKIHYKPA